MSYPLYQSDAPPVVELQNLQRLGGQSGFSYTPAEQQLAYKVLQKFQQLGIYTYQPVEENVLYGILDKMSGGEFDKEVARQLYEQCGPDFKGRVFIEDYVRASFDAKKILSEKIRKSKLDLDERKKEQTTISSLLDQSENNVFKNQFDIDSNSVLKVDILEASDLNQQGSPTELPYVILKCSQITHQTTVPFIKDRVNPKWNQFFEFPIQIGSEELKVEILSYDQQQNTNYLLGQVVIPITSLKDQLKVDKWYGIFDARNNSTRGRIRLSLHWIFDKVLYYQSMLDQVTNHIDNINADVIDFNEDVKIIDSYLNANPLPQATIQQQAHQAQRQMVSSMVAEASTPNSLKITCLLAFILLGCAIIQAFTRTPFLDITIGTFILIGFFVNFFERVYFQSILALLLLSILSDFVWLGFFFGSQWSYDGENDQYSEDAHTLMRISLIFVIITIIVKIFLALYLSISLDLLMSMNQHSAFKFGEYQFVIKTRNENPKFHPNENPFFDQINNLGKLPDTTYLKGRFSQVRQEQPPQNNQVPK